jgi:ABC-type cobalamin/Fe3+-siderophores transport system ATPase subunit
MEVGCIGGLRIESDFPLCGLLNDDASDSVLGCVVVRRVGREELMRRADADPTAIALEPGQPGSFLVTAGNEVLIAPAEEASLRSILSFLFGPCLGVIAYRIGAIPLHASAIGVRGGCVGFIGHSGAGKSTLVAALGQRGYSIHSDDICMLRHDGKGALLAWPGIHWIRLSDESVRALNYARALPQLVGRKHTLELQPVACSATARALRAVYVLDQVLPAEAASVERLLGSRAAERVIANVYRPALARRVGVWPQVITCSVSIADHVPVFMFRRPLNFAQMADSLEVLEAHLMALEDVRESA